MNIAKKAVSLVSTTATFISGASMALAAGQIPSGSELGGTVNADQVFLIDNFAELLQGLLNMVLFIAALLVFAYLVWGGIQWITSGGDKGKTEEARNKITAAIVGLAVVAASYAIFRVVLYVLGIADPFGGVPEQIRLYN